MEVVTVMDSICAANFTNISIFCYNKMGNQTVCDVNTSL